MRLLFFFSSTFCQILRIIVIQKIRFDNGIIDIIELFDMFDYYVI